MVESKIIACADAIKFYKKQRNFEFAQMHKEAMESYQLKKLALLEQIDNTEKVEVIQY